MMMKQTNLMLVASAVVVFLCIHHANSKPLTEPEPQGAPSSFVSSGAEVEYENGLDLLRRITRQADSANGNNKPCKYKKGLWSACDPQTKVRTRTFTLKKGDRAVCEEQKTIRKECKEKRQGGNGNGGGREKKNKSRDNNNEKSKNNRERGERPRNKKNHNNN